MSFNFRRSFLGIFVSGAGAQLVQILSMPLLTRLYSKDEFGEFGVFVVFALLLSGLVSAKLEYSIHEPGFDADEMANTSLHVICLSSVTISLMVPLTGVMSGWFGFPPLPFSPWLVVLHALGWGTINVVMIHSNFHGNYRLIAIANLAPVLLFAGLATIFSRAGLPVNGLIAAQAVSFALAGFVALLLARGIPWRMSLRSIWAVAKTARANTILLIPSGVMSVVSLNLLVIGTSLLYASQIVGLVVVCQRLVRAPVALVTRPFGEILRNSFTEQDASLAVFHRIAFLSSILAALSFLTVWILPERAFALLLGAEWSEAKSVAMILIVAASCQMLGSWVNPVYVCYRKQHELMFQILLIASGVVAILLAFLLKLQSNLYLGVHVVAMSSVYLLSLLNARRILTSVAKKRNNGV